jgi:hypothetical protein
MTVDLICLIETHNQESIDYKIPGYYCIIRKKDSNKQPPKLSSDFT